MTKYLIGFVDGAMTFPEDGLPAVDAAAHAVFQEAKDTGVFVFAGGLTDPAETSVVATHGTVTDGQDPESTRYLGGFAIVDVPSLAEALAWAAKFAVA